ncbi:flavin reductase family protein [Actinokineospora sp. PR83]|uniref:flavin reductase family protein n=1 Tax=Actinokineospora sp. PR83 TaxID=2884908 RepID=UPI0027DF334D|nr:flavin reductase family protein [Actinokineospora sp. PR83]MCG8914462.1 flavin reductase family protein [Actinokineospora sp. PR83]
MTEDLLPAVPTAEGFRAMMRGYPTGVVVVTARDAGGMPWGMTCSSLCSVAVDPPTLLVSLRAASPTLAAVLEAGAFCVNVLHGGARHVAELFASGAPDRFDRVPWEPSAAGPRLTGAARTVAECAVVGTRPVADHVVVFGSVGSVTELPGDPLLYGFRGYRTWQAR